MDAQQKLGMAYQPFALGAEGKAAAGREGGREGVPLGCDSPSFSTIVLFENRPFLLGLVRILERRIPRKNGKGTPRVPLTGGALRPKIGKTGSAETLYPKRMTRGFGSSWSGRCSSLLQFVLGKMS